MEDIKYSLENKVDEIKEMGVDEIVHKTAQSITEFNENEERRRKRECLQMCNEYERKLKKYEATHSGADSEQKAKEMREKINAMKDYCRQK